MEIDDTRGVCFILVTPTGADRLRDFVQGGQGQCTWEYDPPFVEPPVVQLTNIDMERNHRVELNTRFGTKVDSGDLDDTQMMVTIIGLDG